MSHPNKKRPEDLRTTRHVLLLTEHEHAVYKRKAAAAGVSINQWIRMQVNDAEEVVRLRVYDLAGDFIDYPITGLPASGEAGKQP